MDNKLNEDINFILKHASQDEVKNAINDAQEARETATNEFNTSASKVNRQTLKLPPTVVHWITIKYGKEIWRDKKFIKELWDTYKVFRACERF